MAGKARSFSDDAKEANYEKQFGNEVYSAGAQQNSYNLGSVHFSDQSGIANISQAGTDQRKASLQGALYRGNIGFDLQTVELDVPTMSIDLNNDATGVVLDVISTDRFVVLSAGTIGELVTITGAQRPGQRLRLYNTLTNTITIQHTAAATPDTIRTPDGNPVTFEGNAVLDFTFDITTAQWRVVGGPGTGGGASDTGTYTTADMDQDQGVNLAGGQHIQINQVIEDGGIVLQGQTPTFDQTSGIFELKEGKTYYLSAFIVGEVNAATDFAGIAWYDITNATEISRRTALEPMNKAQTLTCNGAIQTIYTPVTDVTVELRVVSLIGALTAVFQRATQVSIFEFSGKNGPPGADGSTAWKTPARAKTQQNAPDLNNFNVIVDGVTLVEDDRVLLTEQTTQAENGLWQVGVVAVGLAQLTRPTDFDQDDEVIAETMVAIEEGSNSKNQLWHLISDNPLTVNVSAQAWRELTGAGAIGPDMGQDNEGNDATGQFVFDGRIYSAYDKLKRVQQYWNLKFPTGEIGDMILLPATPYDHGDLAPEINPDPKKNPRPRLVVVGEQGGIGGAFFTQSSYSDNYGESWTNNTTDLGINIVWRRLTFDPVGVVLICLDDGFGGINDNIGVSQDRGATWANASGARPSSLNDVIWVDSLSLFVGPERITGVNIMWTSPDGNNWTQRTTPAMVGFGYSVEFNPTTGLIYCWTHQNELITSADGITWSAIINTVGQTNQNAPWKTVWSEGQQKFVTKPRQFFANDGTYHSEDGINWIHYDTITDMVQLVDNFIYADELSLWIIAGQPNTGLRQPFAISNDAITWENMPPSGVMRNQDYDIPESSSAGLMQPRGIAFSDNFNYFFACGGNTQSTQNNFFRTRFWRTDVYFNEVGTATITPRDASPPR